MCVCVFCSCCSLDTNCALSILPQTKTAQTFDITRNQTQIRWLWSQFTVQCILVCFRIKEAEKRFFCRYPTCVRACDGKTCGRRWLKDYRGLFLFKSCIKVCICVMLQHSQNGPVLAHCLTRVKRLFGLTASILLGAFSPPLKHFLIQTRIIASNLHENML